MFGYRYNLICPFCGKKYEADHGITAFFKINDILYIEEHCYDCDTRYIRPCGDDVCPVTTTTEGSIKWDDVAKEDRKVYTVCCF